jgi:hypothetical protein
MQESQERQPLRVDAELEVEINNAGGKLELLSTRNMEQQIQQSSMPVSHLGCWCNSYRKRDTNNVSKENRLAELLNDKTRETI